MKSTVRNKRTITKLGLPLSYMTICIMLSTDLAAQSSYEIEEIIVTGRKIEEGLQDAPLAISAFSENDLKNMAATDITDVALLAPNVHFQYGGATSGVSATPTVFIRGIGQSDFNVNNDPAVGMYVDGVYLGRMLGSLTDLMDLSRVEVLRGPQGTLFGRNSIGGAINLISKKPEVNGDVEGNFTAALGERNYRFLKGAANIPISDKSAARVAGFVRQRDGYVDAVQYDDLALGGEDVWGVRGAFRYEANDNLSIDISADWSERRDPPAAILPTQLGNVSLEPGSGNVAGDERSTFASGFRFNTGLAHYGAAPLPPPNAAWISSDIATCSNAALVNTSQACFGNAHILGNNQVNSVWVDKNGNKIVPEQKLDAGGVSLVVNWDLDFGTITATSAYREMDASFNNDNDFTPFIIFQNLNDQFIQDQFSQELQIAGRASAKIQYVAGVYYFSESAQQDVSLVAPLLPPAGAAPAAATLPFFQTVERIVDNTSRAVYGQVVYSLTDELSLTGGLRYTSNEKAIELNLFRGNEASPWFELQREDNFTSNELNTLLNLSWKFNKDAMIYGQFSNGFRDGGWPVRFPGLPEGIPPLDTVDFDSETVNAYELGIKSSLLSGALRLNAAIFLTDYQDMQLQFSDPLLNGAPNTSNLGEATIAGFEVEANYLLSDNLRLDVSIGHLDASLDSIVGDVLATGSDNTVGEITKENELPYTPNWKVSVGLNHTFDIESGAYIRSRIDYTYTDDQFHTIENSPRNFQEAYGVLNASITYVTPEEDWELSIGAKNLTDEEYSTVSRTQADSSSVFENLARPREIYLQFRYMFESL